MKFRIGIGTLVLALMTIPVVASAAECQVVVLRPIIDDIGNPWAPGKKLLVDIERDGANGGAFCASGGSCLPRQSDGAAAIRLLNCHIGPSIGGTDRKLAHPLHKPGG